MLKLKRPNLQAEMEMIEAEVIVEPAPELEVDYSSEELVSPEEVVEDAPTNSTSNDTALDETMRKLFAERKAREQAAKEAGATSEASPMDKTPDTPQDASQSSDENKAEEKSSIDEDNDDEFDEAKNPFFAACLKAAGDAGFSGDEQRQRAIDLYRQEKQRQQKNNNPENAQNQRQQEHRGQSGVGFSLGLGSMLGSLFSKTTNTGKVTKDAVSERILKHRVEKLNQNYHDMSESMKTLDKEVVTLNKVFEKSLGGQALKEIAKERGLSIPQLVADVENGKIDSVQAKLALENAMENPEFKESWSKVEQAQVELGSAIERTGASFSKMHKNHGDRFDAEGFGKHLDKKLNEIPNITKPVAGTLDNRDRVKEFEKHLTDMMERMRKIFERIFNKVVKILSR